jgi:hypothetical protein
MIPQAVMVHAWLKRDCCNTLTLAAVTAAEAAAAACVHPGDTLNQGDEGSVLATSSARRAVLRTWVVMGWAERAAVWEELGVMQLQHKHPHRQRL